MGCFWVRNMPESWENEIWADKLVKNIINNLPLVWQVALTAVKLQVDGKTCHVKHPIRTSFLSRVHTYSVLTRILPWGVPGPPLLRNRGPVRTLGGQSYKKHAVRRTWARTPNCLLHEVPIWSNMVEEVFTIRRRSLQCSGTCVEPMKVKATKLDFDSFDIMFFIYSNKQNALVLGWPLKLLKSVWFVACSCALTGASSWI